MLEIGNLHHVSLVVTDLERARRIYGEVLGLREIARPPFDFPGAWYAAGDGQIHLIVHPGARARRGTTEIDPRDAHVALRVGSYRRTREHLLERGVAIRENPGSITGWPQIYVCDPDGNIIELNAARLD